MMQRLKRTAALALSLVMAFSLLCVPASAASGTVYADISKEDTCYHAAVYLKNAQYMIGTGDGCFSPDDPVSRGMAATVLYRIAGEPAVTAAASFSDFQAGRYDSDAIIWAYDAKILTGCPNRTIQANRPISGAEANAILTRYAQNIAGAEVAGAADEALPTLSRGDFAVAVHQMCVQLSLAQLKESFALTVDAGGLSAAELLEKGRQYEKGDGVTQWYAMAMACYEAAQKAGSKDAAAAIQALNEYKQKVLDNSPDAQGEVFEFFRTGVTAQQKGDYEMAYAVYFDDAFFFEDPELRGIGSLGDLLRDGSGVERDIERAVAIYQFNAEVLGKGNGYSSLGLLYQAKDGTYPGIKHSDEKALEYFVKSFQGEGLKSTDFKGPRYAADYFDAGYTRDDGTSVPPDYVKAEEAYIAASKGNGRTFDGTACYKLGVYYEEGREGVAQDYEKAAEYYLKAVSDPNVHATMLGIPQTYLSLGRFYENGLGVEKNIETAVSYYTKARDAAQENIDLVNAAGNEAAKEVLAEANAALKRLGK